ncbi:MAG: hypothetical protein M3Q03_20915 [Chloroflexota bacterium]|nr:hypothetical protein [Chloroflexota bacterium]
MSSVPAGSQPVVPAAFDLALIALTTLHPQTAISMAGLVVERAQHPEFSTLGEIDRRAARRTAWFGAGSTPSPVSVTDARNAPVVRAGGNPTLCGGGSAAAAQTRSGRNQAT